MSSPINTVSIIVSKHGDLGKATLLAETDGQNYTFRLRIGKQKSSPLIVSVSDVPSHPYDIHQMMLGLLTPICLEELHGANDNARAIAEAVVKLRS